MTPLEVLGRAREILEVGGWRRDAAGDSTDRSTPHCLMGAMTCAAFELSDADGGWPSLMAELETERFVIAALRERGLVDVEPHSSNHFLIITSANDQKLRSAEEAVAVLARATELAKESSR